MGAKKEISVEIIPMNNSTVLERPMFPFGLSAGFPSPAMDFEEIGIDLNKHIIKHPYSTYFGRVSGDSMKDSGINDGDLLVIDKSIDFVDNKIVVCFIDGEFTLKRFRKDKDGAWLLPSNEKYSPIRVNDENEFIIWGVVTFVIKAF
ncbi:MAG: translesion error-prone DNA polymerase V autoproteolytic subunit [Bacteroidales bacterium]|jgi:DNA polymerase V|nr:translesion error-prone DNA polymerase V autoproteolytic subunit [Bacteroidales bacterium]MDD4703501.1 translesion error-prone DNA polymerase V autoproteolytic subunit [Bacteroidales bacterium]MDX9798515.1 translesion error-prone DNA polymerase V autoproteolytic subunit [Bacteroidales bacterium]